MGIFGRDTTRPGFDNPPPAGVGEDPRTRTSGSPERSPISRGGTVIGSGVRFDGELTGEEDVVVGGRFEGRIDLSGQLTVGASGEVRADVHGRNVLIAGKVVGNVSAAEKVELVATASLDGNIRAAKIVIAEGAHFKGSVDMSDGKGGKPETRSARTTEPTGEETVPAGGKGKGRN